MANLHRRTVLLGAGALAGLAGATAVGVAQAHAEPAPSDVDLALLRRTSHWRRTPGGAAALPTVR
ncbi:hypothetical protein JYB55_09960 [Mycolicibacterium septicum]|nr:hypothetical protein [Mycolicibacterium septicum]